MQYNDGSGQDSTVTNVSQGTGSPDSVESPTRPRKTKVVLDERNYVIELDNINMFPSEYKDCEIEITGKVYTDSKMKSNEFAIVRPMMSCCSADSVLAGFLCQSNGKINVQKDSWIKVIGKISVVNGATEQTIFVAVNNILEAQKPKNEFVYPY
jgi:putative membrane protein